MTITLCPTCQNQIHNKARLCLHCLAAHQPTRLRIAPTQHRMPSLDARHLEAWALRFQLIEKAGGADLPRWRRLTVFEWLVVCLNPGALLLGPLYFIHLGLWKRALTITGAWVLIPATGLLLVNHAMALFADLPTRLPAQWLAVRPLACGVLWLLAALAFAVPVNRDFYRKREREEGDWGGYFGHWRGEARR